jgi:hypothetical protein
VPPLPTHRSSKLYDLICALVSPNPVDRPTAESLLQHPEALVASQSCILQAVHDVCWGDAPMDGPRANHDRDAMEIGQQDESPVHSNRFPRTRTSAGPGHNSHVRTVFIYVALSDSLVV